MYRIWDKVNKELMKNVTLGSDNTVYLATNPKIIEFNQKWQVDQEVVPKDNYIVQQCTGLKDKNGVLIYEGDTGIFDTGIYRSNLEKIVYKNGAYYCGIGLLNKFVADNFDIIGNIMEDNNET